MYSSRVSRSSAISGPGLDAFKLTADDSSQFGKVQRQKWGGSTWQEADHHCDGILINFRRQRTSTTHLRIKSRRGGRECQILGG